MNSWKIVIEGINTAYNEGLTETEQTGQPTVPCERSYQCAPACHEQDFPHCRRGEWVILDPRDGRNETTKDRRCRCQADQLRYAKVHTIDDNTRDEFDQSCRRELKDQEVTMRAARSASGAIDREKTTVGNWQGHTDGDRYEDDEYSQPAPRSQHADVGYIKEKLIRDAP